MTLETKRVKLEPHPVSEEEANEEVVNDSLGTVDLSDSTGLDGSDPTGGDRHKKPSGKAEDNA